MRTHTLHYITTGRLSLAATLSVASMPGVSGSVQAFHIREKQRSAGELLNWARALALAVGPGRTWINDRVDVAAIIGAGGVQLPASGLCPGEARPLLPAHCLIGRSIHSAEEAAEAQAAGADYLLYGHIYETGCKPGLPPRGLVTLADIVAASDIPVLAIGGITPERVPEVLATGCSGIAVMSTGYESADPERTALAYRDALDNFDAEPRCVWPSAGRQQPEEEMQHDHV